jgi:hypothetical protein
MVFAALAASIALAVYGFFTVRPWTQGIWDPVGIERLGFYIGLFAGVATPVLILAPWALAPLAATVALAGTILAAGWAATLAPLLFLSSAWALGSFLLRPKERSLEAHLLSTLLGVAVYVWLMTLTARLPIQYAWAWLLLLALPLLWSARWRGGDARGPVLGSLAPPHRWCLRDYLSLALLCFILGMHWLVVLKPEGSADGLSVHLAVASNIAAHHAYTVDPARLIWAVMPMGADWTYSIVYLLGGEFAARLLNFAYLLLMAALLYAVMRRSISRAPALLLLAVFTATPLVQLVTGELFVENLQALLLLGMVVSLAGTSWPPAKSAYLAATLAGAALATKVGSLAFVAAAIPVAVWGTRAGQRPARRWALAGCLLLATAAPTYLTAWHATGNPLYPYFNRVFPSAMLPAGMNVDDPRFRQPLRWSTLYDLTFHTHRYYEGQDGSFGFQFLVLAPLALLAALALRRDRAFLAVGLAGMLLVLISTPNARYLYAGLPLLTAAGAAALGWMAEKQRWAYRAALGYLGVCALGNICFLPASSWYHKNFYLPRPLAPHSQALHTSMVSPGRDVAIDFRRRHPGRNVLLAGDNSQADLAADAHEFGWHEPVLYQAIHRTLDVPAMARLIEQWKIEYVIARAPRMGEWFHPPVLGELLARCGHTEYEFEPCYLARLDPQCLEHPPADPPPAAVPPGSYDDFDTALRFRGDWDHSREFDGPFRHSVSFIDVAGAEAALAFEASDVTYVFTRAPNRGIAEIRIDGVPRAAVDLYSQRVEWQSRFRICCLGPGRHEIAIRVTGRKQEASEGSFVDVDALVVE